MNLSRIFANAIARRIAYVVVAMVLAWLGLGQARAANYGSQGEAYAACKASESLATSVGGYSRRPESCAVVLAGNPQGWLNYHCSVTSNGTDNWSCSFINGAAQTDHQFPQSTSCSARPDHVGAPPTSTQSGQVRQGSLSCVNGCSASWFNNGDGTWTGKFSGGSLCTAESLKDDCPALGEGWYWNAFLQACEPPLEECAANQVKNSATGVCEEGCPAGMKLNAEGQCEPEKSECPAGQIKSPEGACLPGEGQCAAGEARRKDGTCGKDSNGDGVADDDDEDPDNDSDKETFSGGDNCNNPPSCSGSPVMCGQARIQWRIDCNTRRNRNVSGGSCGAMPICTGEKCDAVEYSQLLMQWRTACALERMGEGGPGGGDNSDLIDLLTGPGSISPDLGGTGDMPGGGGPTWGDGEEVEPDDSGFGYGSSCPQPPSFSVGGQTISIDISVFCDWVALGGTIVLIMASLACVRIVAGSAT